MRNILRWAAILLALVWSIGPIVLVVASSFKEARDIFSTPPSLIFTPTLDNYRALWDEHPIFFRALASASRSVGRDSAALVASLIKEICRFNSSLFGVISSSCA